MNSKKSKGIVRTTDLKWGNQSSISHWNPHARVPTAQGDGVVEVTELCPCYPSGPLLAQNGCYNSRDDNGATEGSD
jgi:hypothetical protein